MTVTFCGHNKEDYDNITEQKLYHTLENLIKYGADEFLFGGYGKFDLISAKILKELKIKYPNIKSVLVIPYLNRRYDLAMYDFSVYPPLENVPLKFAILKRNEWMVLKSQVVVAYVKYPFSGAAKTLSFAERKKKQIINICKL